MNEQQPQAVPASNTPATSGRLLALKHMLSGRGRLRILAGRQDLVIFAILIGLVVVLSLTTNTFLTSNNLLNVVRNLSWIAIAAFGECLVIITGGIDLSVGSVMALAGVVSAFCMQAGMPVWLSIVLGLASGGLVGALNGFLVGRVRLPAFIVTLGSMSVARGLIFGLTGGWPVRDLPDSFRWMGNDLTLGNWSVPLPVLIMLALGLGLFFLLGYTVLGTYIYTLGDSDRALTVVGVKHADVKMAVYTFCGLFAAAGGLLMTARLGVAAPTAATGYELDIIAAAVIGGISLFGGEGGVWGVLLGAAFMQVLHNALVLFGLAAHWQSVMVGLVILLALLMDYGRRKRLMQE